MKFQINSNFFYHFVRDRVVLRDCRSGKLPSNFTAVSRMASSAPFISRKQQLENFQTELKKSKEIVVLTGAGISAESGIPTFRGAGGFWGKYSATELATYGAFVTNPSLVWQFYEFRRDTVLKTQPNPGHFALAECEKNLREKGRKLTVITQNIDGLHQRAGSENVIEIHGSMFKTRCESCGVVEKNDAVPICPSLKDAKPPEPEDKNPRQIPKEDLPRCQSCKGLLRPHVVWFGENLDEKVLDQVYQALDTCDLCLVVGTSSLVYPAATFAPHVDSRGVSVAEFNMEFTQAAGVGKYLFPGPSGTTLPECLAPLLSKSKTA